MSSPAPVLPAECLVVRLTAGARIARVHWRADDPIFFGHANNRFSAPAGEYGTLYASQGLKGAFAETVLRKAARIIAWPIVEKRSWSVLELTRDIDLAQLHGDGLAWHGVTGDICTGDDYGPPQALSLAFHGIGLEGIAYRSRHNNDELCYALFDRVGPTALALIETYHFAEAPGVADDLIRQHNAAWDPMLALPDPSKLS